MVFTPESLSLSVCVFGPTVAPLFKQACQAVVCTLCMVTCKSVPLALVCIGLGQFCLESSAGVLGVQDSDPGVAVPFGQEELVGQPRSRSG